MKCINLLKKCLIVSVIYLISILAVFAEDYPKKDIMHIMPWSAGGGTDTVMRTFMKHAEKTLNVGINTQNITGAQSGIGSLKLMKSRPDGYTIGTLTWDSVITVPYYELVPGYDITQLSYLGSVTIHPTAIIVKTDAPWQTLDEFIKSAQKEPNKINISNVGTGGVWHLPALDFANQAKIEVQHVPYPKGSGPQLEALLSGETVAASTSLSAAYSAIKSGQVRILAIMSEERDKNFPDAPTFIELGYNLNWGGFRLIATQARVDKGQKDILENSFSKVFQDVEFQKLSDETGMGAVWMDSKDTETYVNDSQKKAFKLMDELIEKGILKK